MDCKLTYREAVNLAMIREMEADPSVFTFGLDVPDHKRIFGSTRNLVEKFGLRRCFGAPLSEDALTGVALGAALSGLRPVLVHIRADFMLLSMNQIANMVSCLRYMSGGKCRIPLVIRAVIRARMGTVGPAQQIASRNFRPHSRFKGCPSQQTAGRLQPFTNGHSR